MIKYNKILIYLYLCILTACVDNGKPPIGKSPRVFKNTSGWRAASAIMSEDTIKLGIEVRNNINLRYLKDPFYGQSLLFTAVLNNKVKSTEKLLSLGFDPNCVSDTIGHEGSTTIYHAAADDRISIDILKLLLDYGGNPNSKQRFSLRSCGYKTVVQDTINQSAITAAAANDMDKVGLLLAYGADINAKEGTSPLDMAVSLDMMEMTLYLLENGADYNERFEVRDYSYQNGKVVGYITLADKLRYVLVPLDSHEYEYKMKVVEFLKKRGLDYDDTEIPDHAIKLIKRRYPDTWEEYLKVY